MPVCVCVRDEERVKESVFTTQLVPIKWETSAKVKVITLAGYELVQSSDGQQEDEGDKQTDKEHLTLSSRQTVSSVYVPSWSCWIYPLPH